jgi:hypothetical protein
MSVSLVSLLSHETHFSYTFQTLLFICFQNNLLSDPLLAAPLRELDIGTVRSGIGVYNMKANTEMNPETWIIFNHSQGTGFVSIK